MKVVVDTNIIFSALLNPKSTIGDIILNFQEEIEFFAPSFLIQELSKYQDKLIQLSKLSEKDLSQAIDLIVKKISFISEELISENSWLKAYSFTKDIDEKDTPFVALSLELGIKLWTGDTKLEKGLLKKGIDMVITTDKLKGKFK